ncbi:heavy metal translocating P-type ATPase [Pararhizobium haloflavum]|uniref:heavy metal translocating P-type ATPase n=1 Tax=Pararhizobium haloflavum TaxID=2037914 RepID=UPI000C1959EC|nr:heavy metal translocating P-type ATPase [Pararhizobium haloflavum]
MTETQAINLASRDARSQSGAIFGQASLRQRRWPFIYWLFGFTFAAWFIGGALWLVERPALAHAAWWAGTVIVLASLLVAMVRAFMAGRIGVDAIAFISMAAALALSETFVGNVIAIMYAGGNVLEAYAVGRAERDLSALEARAPTKAHRVAGDRIEDISAASVAPGDRLLVKPGEILPVDGTLQSDEAEIDESTMTGEPLPVNHRKGDIVRSGTLNAAGGFEMSALATADASTYAGLLRLVGSARAERAPFVRMADRLAIVLLPLTLALGGVAWWITGDPTRALAVLVVATPCPLILAAPVAFISGVSRTARKGVLLRGGSVIEALAEVRTAIFDKTGTLTEGRARLIGIATAPGITGDVVLRAAASLEQASHHALAASVVEAATASGHSLHIPSHVREFHGSGVEGMVDGQAVKIGSIGLFEPTATSTEWIRHGLRRARRQGALTILVAIDGKVAGMLIMADKLRPEAAASVRWLRHLGIDRLVMLTGDTQEGADRVAAGLQLDAVFAGCAPAEKLEILRQETQRAPVLMIGDGINDAPSLAAAHVGIALGARGGSAASQSADAVVLVDAIDRVAQAVHIAQDTRRIARQSVVAGLALSLVAMIVAAFGYLPPVAGALTQEAIDVAVILNALRALGPIARAERKDAGDRLQVEREHRAIARAVDRLQEMSDKLDDEASGQATSAILADAVALARRTILDHEIRDDRERYARGPDGRQDRAVVTALGYAHSEIFMLVQRLETIAEECARTEAGKELIGEARQLIDELATWVRLHNAIEDSLASGL